MIAEIICVGTELLLGDILNTNAQFLSRRLAELGVSVYYQSVVGDNEERLLKQIEIAQGRCDMILFSGGLGPTTDDLTKETVAKALGLPLYEDHEEAEKILRFFEKRGIQMTSNNLKQALIPEGATILKNDNGTAPGVCIEKDGKIYAILPGPPNELIPMFNERVVPIIKNKTTELLLSRTLRMVGISESTAASVLGEIIEHQTNPSIAPYAKLSEVHFRITAKATDLQEATRLIDGLEGQVMNLLGQYVYTNKDQELEDVVVELLSQKGLTLSVAESCTAGYFSGNLVKCSGASKVFHQGVIAYANEVKERELGVQKETLIKYGAVSEETAKEMAKGICLRSGSDLGLAITGIAGPTGGTEEKPVGLVYVAIAGAEKTRIHQLNLLGNREKIRASAAKQALIFLYQFLRQLG